MTNVRFSIVITLWILSFAARNCLGEAVLPSLEKPGTNAAQMAIPELPRLQSSVFVGTNAVTNAATALRAETNGWLAPVTNASVLSGTNSQLQLAQYQETLDFARGQRAAQAPSIAEHALLQLLDSAAPDEIKRPALLELALVAQEVKQLPKAQQLFAKYARLYASDPSLPEILYRQGLLYREMGASVMALSKFYAVMSTSLTLKLDQFAYYQRLVLLAKIEIADTYYLQASFEEASDYLTRLLKSEDPALNRAIVQYKLIRSLNNLGRNTEVAAQAKSYLSAFHESNDAAEVRFLFADSLRKLGRNRDAMEQVLVLLQSQQAVAEKNPDNWRYWQQRTGNDIANQLYKEGDYLNALEIYLNLSKLDNTPSWKCPVLYQIGLTYERLQQPGKANEAYDSILKSEGPINTATSSSLGQLVEMARWRKSTLAWVTQANEVVRSVTVPTSDASKISTQ